MSADRTPNAFIQNLASLCAENLLAEKWLLAPNRRVGNQWVEQVARAGQPAVNLRVTTVPGLVLELAGESAGRLISARGARTLVSRVLDGLRKAGPRYFTTLEPYPSLVRALTRSLQDLRAAGVGSEIIREGGRGGKGDGESPRLRSGRGNADLKMEELADLLAGYEAGLAEGGFTDHAGLLAEVTGDAAAGRVRWPHGRLLLVPDGLDAGGPGQKLLDLVPHISVKGLVPDRAAAAGGPVSDIARLLWLDEPRSAPPPAGDGSLRIMGAAGESNEVRLALRLCLAGHRQLDQVELLYTDAETYLPLLFELFSRLFPLEAGDLDSLPVTFSEGIDSRYSRPGKALLAWAFWILEGHPPQGLAAMIREGLLVMREGTGPDERAAAADLLPMVWAGPEGTPAALERMVVQERERLTTEAEEDGEEPTGREGRLAALRQIQSLMASLGSCIPGKGDPLPEVLESASHFLDTVVRTGGQLDEYARTRLRGELADARRHMDILGHHPPGDPLLWVVSMVRETAIAGSGPRPGRLHVAPLALGGHSGRPHVVVMGLDDGRFPGSDRQEPVLLDSEREDLSPLLPLAADGLKSREAFLPALAARMPGGNGPTLTLTCSLRDLLQDRDAFPGSTLMQCFRILTGADADQRALMEHMLPPAAFVVPGGAPLDASQWWVERFTAPARIPEILHVFASRFAHLEHGMAASAGRLSPRATAYEGMVGPLPPELDILSGEGPAISAHRLQTLGTCPLRYFFRYVLGVETVEEELPEPGIWLTPAQKGSLLHELFHLYVSRLIAEGRTPDSGRDGPGLDALLDTLLDRQERDAPPPSIHAREHERAQLRESARIFLREEEEFAREHRPTWAEASIGVPPTDVPTELDCPDPVLVSLGPDRTIRVRGRVDRIDRRVSDGCFVITDYKSGSARLYTQKDRFSDGRVVQHLLYLLMIEARLQETQALPSPVAAFRFLFPSHREQGESLILGREELEGGMEVLNDLCDMAAAGCFFPTDDAGDCRWCDYAVICGDTSDLARRARAKLDGTDERLDPLRRLRGYA